MLDELQDEAIDTTFFDSAGSSFQGTLRTTWEELVRQGCLEKIEDSSLYRLTPKGWLTALELTGRSKSSGLQERLGKLFAAMKRHVDGRREPGVVSLKDLAKESGEPEGWIFNVIESRSISTENKRVGADWYDEERGRLVLIPIAFNLEPVGITTVFTAEHLARIEELETQLQTD